MCAAPPAQAASALAELIAEIQTSDQFHPETVEALYRETVLRGDGIDRAIARLQAYSRGAALSPAAQANCHLAIAHLNWRDGAIEEAVASSEKALQSSPTADALLLKARLLDTGGEKNAAREWYQRAADSFGDGDEQWLIRVRLAIMEVSGSNVQALEDLATQRNQEFRNQAAVVLALLGRPERAITLYRPLEKDGKLYRQHLRLAEWALQAGDHDLAREQAWLAYADAEIRAEDLYALALLAESYREAGELALLLEELAQRDPSDLELLRLRVETLIETEEYDQAIALYRQLGGDQADVAERRRLVSLYEAAGDIDAMVREYRRMMEAEPDQVQWYDGLAAHYLNQADNDNALEVWATLRARNPDRTEILVEAADLMLQMGFMEQAVAMIQDHMEARGPDVGALLFLFDAWLDKGRDDEALEALVRLEGHLAPDATERRDLADAFERLSRPEEALRIFETIRDLTGGLGYDEQMRLAWLYSVVGRKEDALRLWRKIWVGVESPARRSFAESQLMLLASELGTLGDIVAELEGMLIEGTANRNHMNLLVRIYTEVGDKLSATEIIDEYASRMGETEIGREELLAQVFMLLEDYPAHDKVLRRLYEIDTVNRVDHIKSIIINLLTFDLATGSDERFEEINQWIGELRKFDAEAVGGEFEASIYSMAGFGEQAMESYRRALVEQPQNSDNLLLLADVMKNNGRADEAVAILQFFAENAVEDNDFVVAVDGIINMIGTRTFFQQPDSDMLARLDWTRRVILERVAGRANKFYLYELLSDIAQEKGDTEGSFVALENSLAEAGLRRPAILRELLTMATPNAGFSGFNTGAGDIARQLRHGRRLVGLRQLLPPEVYIDIGKSLLKKEDVSGAERAFEMIDDITGLIDVNRTKAEIFEEEDFDQQAREYYNRALNVNRDSLELLHKTAFLYEADGREEVAFRRYLQAISGLLLRQAVVLAAVQPPVDPNLLPTLLGRITDTTVSREFREHYASLEQGLLLTWPEDPAGSTEAVEELKALFDNELRNTLDRAQGELMLLARYARLDRLARLIRRVGFFLKDPELSQYADLSLLEHFAEDQEYAQQLDKQYGDVGWPRPHSPGTDGVPALETAQASRTTVTPLRKQLELAADRNDFETRLQLLRLAGATEELEALLGERIQDGYYRDGLGYALAFLGEREFKRLALALAPRLMEDHAALLSLLRSGAEMYLKTEEVAGRALVPVEDIVALLLSPDAWEPSEGLRTDTRGYWVYLKARASLDDRIRILQGLVERWGVAQLGFGFDAGQLSRDLLKESLSARQRQDLTEVMIEFLSKQETNNENIHFMLIPLVLVADARPDNAEVLYRVADYVAQRWPAIPSMRTLLRALYSDRSDEAFRAYVALKDPMPAQTEYLFSGVAGFLEALSGPRSRLLDDLAAGRPVDGKLARAAYDMEFFQFRGPVSAPEKLNRQAQLLDRLIELNPEDRELRFSRIEVWLSLGQVQRAGEAIAAEFQAESDDDAWRLAYFLFLKSQQRFAEALAVATDGGTDLRDAALLQEAISAHARSGGRPVFRIVQRLQVQATAASPMALLGLGAPGNRPGGAINRLREALQSGDHENGRTALREAWRGLLTRKSSPYGPAPGTTPLQFVASGLLNAPLQIPAQGRTASSGFSGAIMMGAGVVAAIPLSAPSRSAASEPPGEQAEPRMLFDAVAEAPYGAMELDAFLRAMPDENRKSFHQLYEYLATASKAHEGAERLRELSTRVLAQDIDDHEFTLWMILRDEAKDDFGPGGLQAFERRVAEMTDPAPYQLLLAARLFATVGAIEQAAEHYKLVAARRIQHREYAARQFGPFGAVSTAVNDLSSLIDEVAEKLPPEAARQVVGEVLRIARRAESVPGSESLYDGFALRSLEKLYPPADVLTQAQRVSRSVTEPSGEFGGAGALKAVELARAWARSGDPRRGLEILEQLLADPLSNQTEQPFPGSQQDHQKTVALQALGQLYGISVPGSVVFTPFGTPSLGVRPFLAAAPRLFPVGDDDWPGAMEWTRVLSEAVLVWLEEGALKPDEAVELLVAAGKRPAVADDSAQESDLLQRLMSTIEAGEQPLSASGLMRLAPMAQAWGQSVPFAWVAGRLRKGELSWKQQIDLLQVYADSPDAPGLLGLFRELGLDQGLAVQQLLLAMAEQANDGPFAEELRQRIKREHAAEKEFLPDEEEAVHSSASHSTVRADSRASASTTSASVWCFVLASTSEANNSGVSSMPFSRCIREPAAGINPVDMPVVPRGCGIVAAFRGHRRGENV